MRHFPRAASRFGSFLLAAGLALPVLSLPVHAEATPEGAAELTAVFQTYLGKVDGVVRVAPEGEAYQVTLDVAPLVATAAPAGQAPGLQATPFTFSLTENGDGTWAYAQDQAFSVHMTVEGALDLSVAADSLVMTGTFDPALMAFRDATTRAKGMTIDETVMQPGQPATTVHETIASLETTTTSKAAALGGVDSQFTQTVTGIEEQVKVAAGPDTPEFAFGAKIARGTGTGDLHGLRVEPLLRLWVWAVAHPSSTAQAGDRAEVKALIMDSLPVFRDLSAGVTLEEMSLDTPVGEIGVAQVGVEVAANGVVADGKLREAFRFKGLTLPAGLVPDYAAPLVPQEIGLDLTVSDFDADGAARLVLAMLDLPEGQEPPAGFDQSLLNALMPEGAVDVTLAAGGAKNDKVALTWQGSLRAGPAMPMPTGSAVVTLAGMDVVTAALQASPDGGAQVLPMLGMAQAMAKPGADGALVWEIDAATPGSLKVNGTEMMGAPQ